MDVSNLLAGLLAATTAVAAFAFARQAIALAALAAAGAALTVFATAAAIAFALVAAVALFEFVEHEFEPFPTDGNRVALAVPSIELFTNGLDGFFPFALSALVVAVALLGLVATLRLRAITTCALVTTRATKRAIGNLLHDRAVLFGQNTSHECDDNQQTRNDQILHRRLLNVDVMYSLDGNLRRPLYKRHTLNLKCI